MNCCVNRPVVWGGKWSIMGAVLGRFKRHEGSWAEGGAAARFTSSDNRGFSS